jgi:hypothetical protein
LSRGRIWNSKTYDILNIRVKKGQREVIKDYAKDAAIERGKEDAD